MNGKTMQIYCEELNRRKKKIAERNEKKCEWDSTVDSTGSRFQTRKQRKFKSCFTHARLWRNG